MSTTITVRTRIPRAQIIGVLRGIPAVISGRSPDSLGLGQSFKLGYAHHLMQKIYDAFLVKSSGRKDETGTKWKPLKPTTIAYRPLSKTSKRLLAISGLSGRGLLTRKQNQLWSGIFASRFNKLAQRLGTRQAAAMAAKIAWGILKKRGALTKIATLGRMKVPIMVVTGEIERSLLPGKVNGNRYYKPKDQIFDISGPNIRLGTTVEHAKYQDKTRKIIPTSIAMERAGWYKSAVQAGQDALVARLARSLPGARR